MKTTVPAATLNAGLLRGAVVRSTAGHDRDEIFVVLSVENGFARLADGANRRHEAPKKKRVTHVKRLGCLPDTAVLDTIEALGDAGQRNAALRKLLKEHITTHPLKEEL